MADLPTSIWQGTFTVWGVTLHCHVLSDGQRVIDAEDVERLFGAGRVRDDGDLLQFALWQRGGKLP